MSAYVDGELPACMTGSGGCVVVISCCVPGGIFCFYFIGNKRFSPILNW
jgi:hypothetical protein